jgi:hypothetical protein
MVTVKNSEYGDIHGDILFYFFYYFKICFLDKHSGSEVNFRYSKFIHLRCSENMVMCFAMVHTCVCTLNNMIHMCDWIGLDQT